MKETAMEALGTVMPNPNDASRTLARTVDQASTGVHDVIDKVSDAARPMVDRIASGAHQAVDKVASAADHAAETLGMKGEQLKDAQVRMMEQCRGYVRDNPVTALGIAIAAGFLLSRLLSSR
jgi:ElaB protein